MARRLAHRPGGPPPVHVDAADPGVGLVGSAPDAAAEGAGAPLPPPAPATPGAAAGLARPCTGSAVRAVADAALTRPAGPAPDLARLWADRGPAMLDGLAGPFALAVWDGRRRRLLLARDRVGERPLAWWCGGATLVFASEPAALVACPLVPRRLNVAALGNFLRFAYVRAPATGFEAIHVLPPGHYLVFDAATGRLDGPRRWWDIPRGPPERGVPQGQWCERVRRAVREAVRARMGGAGPVGVLVSGGIDSSLIAAVAAEEAGGRPLQAFTATFAEPGWDESAHARAVAGRLGAAHAEVRLEPSCLESLPALVQGGVLLADSSALAVYALARAVRAEVPAALSGDGGDESFGGYERHAALWTSERLPRWLRAGLAPLGRRMPPAAGRKSRWNAARRFLAALDAAPLARYLAWRSLFGPGDLERLLAPEAAREALAGDLLAAWRRLAAGLDERPWIDRAMAIDLQDYLPDDGLAKVDTAAGAHGLEVRSPLLDAAVVELARRMPWQAKWRRRLGRMPQGKRVLREAFASALPGPVRGRGKMGFGVPVSRWLAGPYADWAREVLLDPGARTARLLRREAVGRLLSDHAAARADHGEGIYALLCLELWMRAFGL
jgi:asparagine synthase (glutamine-hydrolysing)